MFIWVLILLGVNSNGMNTKSFGCVVFNFFSCLFLFGCSSYSSNDIGPVIDNEMDSACHASIAQQINELAVPLINKKQTPGIAIALQYNGGDIQFFNYGRTSSLGGEKITEHSLFAIGSLTKGFTAEYAAMLVDEHLFSWQSPLSELLAGGSLVLSPDASKITLEQLVSHTSGLPRQVNDISMLIDLVKYVFTGDQFYKNLDTGESFNYLTNYVRGSGDEVKYSNLGYAILDKVITERTQKKVSEGVELRILKPLGLLETGFNSDKLSPYSEKAVGHSGDQPKFVRRGLPVPDWKFNNYMIGAASLWSTSSDLLKYAMAHYEDNIPDDIKSAFIFALKTRRGKKNGESQSLGWLVSNVYGHTIYYQSGFVGGFASYIGVDAIHHNSIVVLQNSFNWDNKIGHRILYRMAVKSMNGCKYPI